MFWLSIPESQGSRGYYTNIGDMRNTGIEMVLTGVLVSTKDIDWSVTVNMSHNATKVLKLPALKTEQYGGLNASNDSITGIVKEVRCIMHTFLLTLALMRMVRLSTG
ncbi:MAG: hypothetical protein MSB11_05050 [Prevotella sp.]|nr:hypothetical protein [Prevotella sp.]